MSSKCFSLYLIVQTNLGGGPGKNLQHWVKQLHSAIVRDAAASEGDDI